MVNLVQSLKVGGTSYSLKDGNTIPSLTAGQKSVLLASGTYLDKAVVDGKVFETDAGKFERFNKTVVGSSFQWNYLQNPLNSGTGIVYGKGVYVVAGSAGIAYSKDGTNWSQANISVDAQEYSGDKHLAYGNDVFVCVTYNKGTVLYSRDGINWEAFNMPSSGTGWPTTNAWTDVAYVNGRFVAVTNASGIIAYSFNGKDWEAVTVGGYELYGITYGNGRYVAVGRTYCLRSTDCINWDYYTISAQNYTCTSVAYGNGIFVATIESYYNTEVYTSTNGSSWAMRTSVLPAEGYWRSVTFTGEFFVAVGENSSDALGAYSYDGINWVQAKMPSNGAWKDVANAEDKAVAVKSTGEVALGGIETQYDYSTTPLSYTADEVDALVSQATITEDKVDVSTGTLVL